MHDRCQSGRTGHDHGRMDPLSTAFDRIDDFVAVQRAAGEITVEAVELLQQSVGVEDHQRALIAQRVEALGASGGAVLLGVLVGLLAAEAAQR
jgi:hypothetical protein